MYYRHEAPASAFGFFNATVLAVLPLGAAGVVYAFAILHCPIIYACVVLTAGFGWLVGAIGAQVLMWAAVRSSRARQALMVWFAVMAYTVSFAAWLWILVARDMRSWSLMWVVEDPAAMLRVLRWVYENGVWGFGEHFHSVMVNGPMLVCVWVGELGMTVIMPLLIMNRRFTDRPYCEFCRKWCGAPRLLHRYRTASGIEIKLHLEDHDWAYLGTLLSGGRADARCVDLEYSRCETCDRLHTITLTRDTAIIGAGTFKRERMRIMDHLLITREDLTVIEAMRAADEAV